MSKLEAFLRPAVSDKVKEVVVSDRFHGEDGKPAKITIKPITQAENERLIKLSTHTKKDKGQVFEAFDGGEYRARLVVECTVFPDFKQKELCDAYGVVDPLDVSRKMFNSGEYARLIDEIMEINGHKDIEELNEEAKNS